MAESRLRHSVPQIYKAALDEQMLAGLDHYFLGLWVFCSPWFIEHAMIGTQPGAGSRGMLI
jgi:hypothetical protein